MIPAVQAGKIGSTKGSHVFYVQVDCAGLNLIASRLPISDLQKEFSELGLSCMLFLGLLRIVTSRRFSLGASTTGPPFRIGLFGVGIGIVLGEYSLTVDFEAILLEDFPLQANHHDSITRISQN